MRLIDAAVAYGKRKGADGFVCPDECACDFDDPMPCDCASYSCEIGRKVVYGSPECETCDDPSMCEGEWCMSAMEIDG